jgi:hypothetical protein
MMNLADTQPPVALFRIGPMMTSPRRGLNTVLVYMHSVSEGCMSSNMASARIAEAVVMADPPRMKTKGGNSLLKQLGKSFAFTFSVSAHRAASRNMSATCRSKP